MTLEERNTILNSPSFHARIRVAFCDWISYWAINGTDSIEDPTLRSQTESMIQSAVEDIDKYTGKITVLAISDAGVIEATEITDQIIRNAVTSIMSNALEYLM